MLEKDFRVLRLCSVAGIWIHHELGVWQVLRQQEGVDRDHDDVFAAPPRALRAHLPILPHIRIEKTQRIAVRSFRAARASVLRLEGSEGP